MSCIKILIFHRDISSGPAYSSLAISQVLCGNIAKAKKYISLALKTVKDTEAPTYGKDRASASLFLKIRNEEVEKECNRVRDYISYLEKQKLPEIPSYKMRESNTVVFLPQSTPEHIQFDHLFYNKNPIKLEVCSGHGDWIVDKAKKDSKFNWVALEIRYERVFQIWYRMIFNNVQNLVILVRINSNPNN